MLDDFDDMDIEFDDPSTSKKGDNLDICSDDDALGESQESDEMTTQPDGKTLFQQYLGPHQLQYHC